MNQYTIVFECDQKWLMKQFHHKDFRAKYCDQVCLQTEDQKRLKLLVLEIKRSIPNGIKLKRESILLRRMRKLSVVQPLEPLSQIHNTLSGSADVVIVAVRHP